MTEKPHHSHVISFPQISDTEDDEDDGVEYDFFARMTRFRHVSTYYVVRGAHSIRVAILQDSQNSLHYVHSCVLYRANL